MPSIDDYTVGCICALDTEAVALCSFFDDEHATPPIFSSHVSTQDNNVYNVGTMGGHNVVIATLPSGKYGVSSATSVISNMTRSFPNLRFCLMVGIGGGAPSSKHDIRLGDVVVSAPDGRSGGVLQYDHGKMIQDGIFEISGHLNEPPSFLLAAVSKLRQEYKRKGHRMQESVLKILENNPRLAEDYASPDKTTDRLYVSTSTHPRKTKGDCLTVCGTEPSQLVNRLPRKSDIDDPVIHYGVVASGSSLMKNAEIRDKLAQDENVLCFEMEAAGLMNQFPCLVVRGICDYSDTHKNDDWQGYGAMMAAAYSRDILRVLQPWKVASVEKVSDMLSAMTETRDGIHELARTNQMRIEHTERESILNWLTPVDYAHQQNNLQYERCEGTGQWFLEKKLFQEWISEVSLKLFCPGMPGAGKTFIASLVINHIQTNFPSRSEIGLAYIYCNHREHATQTLPALISSLIKQLAQSQQPFPSVLQTTYNMHKPDAARPSVEELIRILLEVVEAYERCFLIIDGVDELQDHGGTRKRLLDIICRRPKVSRSSVFVTSRHVQNIEENFGKDRRLPIRASDTDVGQYLDDQIPRILEMTKGNYVLRKEIKRSIMHSTNGMFLLAVLHLNTLRGSMNVKQVKKALQQVSENEELDSAYNKTMEMINRQEKGCRELAMDTIAWVTFANRPLTSSQLQHALATRVGDSEIDTENITSVEAILSICAGLITLQHIDMRSSSFGYRDSKYITVHLVHETAQKYFEETSQRWFGDIQAKIAQVCLTYVSLQEFGSGSCQSIRDFKNRLSLFPFYEYAVQRLRTHIRQTDAHEIHQLKTFFYSSSHVMSYVQARRMLRFRGLFVPENWKDRSNALHVAVECGLCTMIPHLAHQEPNAWSEGGATALHLAVKKGFTDIVRLLVAVPGVDCDKKDRSGRTPLSHASEIGNLEIVGLLFNPPEIHMDTDGNCKSTSSLRGSIHEDELFAKVELVLVKPDVDPDILDDRQRSPLSYALQAGHDNVVKMLMTRAETNLTTLDYDGKSPLYWAVRSRRIRSIELLLSRHRFDINAPIIDKTPPVCWAAQHNKETFFVLFMSTAGCDLNATDSEGRSPLYWSISGHHEHICRLLLSNIKVDVNIFDRDKRGPLHWAAAWGNESIMGILLERPDARINAKNVAGHTPLHIAVSYRHKGIVALLFSRSDLDLCMQNGVSASPLHYAILSGDEDLLHSILSHIPDKIEVWIDKALLLAMKGGHEPSIKILIAKMKPWIDRTPELKLVLLRAATALSVSQKSLKCLLRELQLQWIDTTGRHDQVKPGKHGWDSKSIDALILVAGNSDIDLRDTKGESPLFSAVRRDDEIVAQILIAMGADEDITDNQNRKILDYVSNRAGTLVFRLKGEPQWRDGG